MVEEVVHFLTLVKVHIQQQRMYLSKNTGSIFKRTFYIKRGSTQLHALEYQPQQFPSPKTIFTARSTKIYLSVFILRIPTRALDKQTSKTAFAFFAKHKKAEISALSLLLLALFVSLRQRRPRRCPDKLFTMLWRPKKKERERWCHLQIQ